jgi:hypothetical protein
LAQYFQKSHPELQALVSVQLKWFEVLLPYLNNHSHLLP